MSERYQDLLKQTLKTISPGKSPEGLTVFYSKLSQLNEPEELAEAFLNVRWEASTNGASVAKIWAKEILSRLTPEDTNNDKKRDKNPMELILDGSDVNLLKAAVLLGKAISLNGKEGTNPYAVMNDIYRAAALIDKSETLPEVKLKAMEFYNSLFLK